MSNLILHQTKDVLCILDSYPEKESDQLYILRQLIIDTAEEIDSISKLEETLKWNKPSYVTKKGTTIRIDWKAKSLEHYAIYVSCTSLLIPTTKKVYVDQLTFEGNSAIIFPIDRPLP